MDGSTTRRRTRGARRARPLLLGALLAALPALPGCQMLGPLISAGAKLFMGGGASSLPTGSLTSLKPTTGGNKRPPPPPPGGGTSTKTKSRLSNAGNGGGGGGAIPTGFGVAGPSSPLPSPAQGKGAKPFPQPVGPLVGAGGAPSQALSVNTFTQNPLPYVDRTLPDGS